MTSEKPRKNHTMDNFSSAPTFLGGKLLGHSAGIFGSGERIKKGWVGTTGIEPLSDKKKVLVSFLGETTLHSKSTPAHNKSYPTLKKTCYIKFPIFTWGVVCTTSLPRRTSAGKYTRAAERSRALPTPRAAGTHPVCRAPARLTLSIGQRMLSVS